MSQNMDDSAWDTVDRLVEWLDTNGTLPPETDKLLRIMKLSEEVGEVSEAVIGVTGQNVRKGVTHTWDDVQAELCDVIFEIDIGRRNVEAPAVNALCQVLES